MFLSIQNEITSLNFCIRVCVAELFLISRDGKSSQREASLHYKPVTSSHDEAALLIQSKGLTEERVRPVARAGAALEGRHAGPAVPGAADEGDLVAPTRRIRAKSTRLPTMQL